MEKRTLRVEAQETYGCAPACIATILGWSYEAVVRKFLNDFRKKGMQHDEATRFVQQQGYSSITKRLGAYNFVDQLKEEMLRPFAEIHLVQVKPQYDARLAHALVMLKDGRLLDPTPDRKDVKADEYYEVIAVTGFWKDKR